MLAGPALGMPVALLWVNLLTHGVPGVALGAEPAESDALRRSPRSPQQSVLGDGLVRSVCDGGARPHPAPGSGRPRRRRNTRVMRATPYS
ncbi:cation-translocating P-type ATPase C-terminal domain-containing protein [Actinoplanes sp. NPDC051633]|uniref:cation-translocating P-type ATPase C-terminal domain-containing protein n=1 Tax=Actinoplanes sp. NPDC051633 TaxID=3155670 RepID=UPI0034350D2B